MAENQAPGEVRLARIVISTIENEVVLARSAAQWLSRFYPHVDVIVDGATISLQSEADDAELSRIWAAALFNERSWGRCQATRRQVLQRLTR